MLYLVMEFSSTASLIKLILMLLGFIALLFLASWFTKWYVGNQGFRSNAKNIEVIESYSMGPGKSISILRLGKKYVAVTITKDTVQNLVELDENDLDLSFYQSQLEKRKEMLEKRKSFQGAFGEVLERYTQKSESQKCDKKDDEE